MHLTHKLVKGKWVISENENTVRIWPQPSPLRNGEEWEKYCREKVLLHVKYRSLQQFKGNEDEEDDIIPWLSIYSQYLIAIRLTCLDRPLTTKMRLWTRKVKTNCLKMMRKRNIGLIGCVLPKWDQTQT